jgi:MFS family permease
MTRATPPPRAFWVLWAGMLVNRIGAVVVPFLALYLTDVRGVPVLAAGYVLVGFGVGSVLSYLTGGWMADRVGRRPTLIAGTLASAVVMVTLGSVRSFPVIVAVAVVLGFTIDLYRPAAAALVADLVAPERRPWAYSQLYWAVNLGFSVATLSGGLLAQHGFVWLVRVDAATSVAFAVLIWRAMPGAPATRRGLPPPRRGSYRSVLTDRVMLAFTAISLLYTIVFIQGTTTLPLVMDQHNLSAADYGFAIAMNGVTILLAQPVAGRWAGRFDHSLVAAAGMALLGAGFGTLALARTTWQYAAAVVIWTLGEATMMSVAQAIVAGLAPAYLRGRYNGVFGMTWSCAFLVGPLAGTWMIDNLGGTALWYACLAAGLLGAVSHVLLGPAVRARTAGRDQTVRHPAPRHRLPAWQPAHRARPAAHRR